MSDEAAVLGAILVKHLRLRVFYSSSMRSGQTSSVTAFEGHVRCTEVGAISNLHIDNFRQHE